jgi:conjugal transfer/entry exclusion protein
MKSSMFDKITQFAASPKGQRMIRQATGKAQQFANDPKNRARIEELRRRFSGGGTTPPR